MPVHYIGRASSFKGKPLFHILLRLKNFGIGRLVKRSIYERYPEPTYYIIRRVQPLMDEKNLFGVVWADLVFRGRKISEQQRLESGCYADFQLIPKEEESFYLSYPDQPIPIKYEPKYKLLPPLMELSIRQNMELKGKIPPQELKMEMQYRKDGVFQEVVAVEDPTQPTPPSAKFELNPQFLEGIQWPQDKRT